MMRTFNILSIILSAAFVGGALRAESEPLEEAQADSPPYNYAGRLFGAASEFGASVSGSGVAVGPGVVLSAAHVYWTEAWENGALPEGASPWRAYRKWHPASSSSASESFDNVVSVVSLASYDDVLHEYDSNRSDSTSPFEAFNRDSLLLIFSDDTPTPHGYIRPHPRAAESGFLSEKNFYEVVGYPSSKYSGSDARKWMNHKTTATDPLVVSKVPSIVYDASYSFDNRLYTGGDDLDSYAGNSGGPVIGRAKDTETWLSVGVYVGSGALFRAMDSELAGLIDTTLTAQIEATSPRFKFSESELSVSEDSESSVTIGVERLGDSTLPTEAIIDIVDFSAEEQIDYTLTTALSWDAGESGIKEITLSVVDDELREGKETLLIALSDTTNTGLDVPNLVSITIEDNDLNGPLDKWTNIDEVGAVSYSEVVFAQGKFVSVGGTNAVRWSPDYQDVSVTDFPGLNRLFQITYARGLFIGCGEGPQIIVSEDAITWEVIELPTSISLFSIQYGHGWFVAVGGIDALGASQGEIWVSRDARNWTKTYDEMHDIFDDVEFGNGRFVARADSDFYVSTDALNWERVETTGISGIPSDIEFGAGIFVTAGRLGGIYTSVDGISWSRARQEDDESWFGVGFRNGHFVATGQAGKLATSSDGGITWIDRIPDTQENLWHGVSAAGKMVVIGDNGHLMESDLPGYFDFIFEPISRTVDTGESVSFFADFLTSEEGPFTMQWRKDGIDIIGETASVLSIPNTSSINEGGYQLLVTGNGTEYKSKVAILELIPLFNPPENLSASTSTSRGARILWDDISTGEIGYLVERRIVGSQVWETVANVGENSSSYTDRQLLPETDYEYRVTTLFEGGGSELVSSTTVATLSATNFINLSSRGLVGTGDDVMIGGFTIPQGSEMTVYIRGLGPSLLSNGISNTISNPQLSLLQLNETNPIEIINTDWGNSDNVSDIIATGLPPAVENESAILATLPAGGYTVVLSDELEGPPAVGLVEIFVVSDDCENCRLINLSTRAIVSTGDELLIGGLVISGSADKRLFVRALGPSLPGVASTLQDPVLQMVSSDGAEASIDNWMDSVNSELISTLDLSFSDDREAGEIYQVGDGIYTFHVTGANDTTGVALLEIFEME